MMLQTKTGHYIEDWRVCQLQEDIEDGGVLVHVDVTIYGEWVTSTIERKQWERLSHLFPTRTYDEPEILLKEIIF